MFKRSTKNNYSRKSLLLLIALLAGVLATAGCGRKVENAVSANQSQSEGATNSLVPAENTSSSALVNQPPETSIPVGTPVSVRLLSNISSSTAEPGDQYEAELASPVIVNGQTVFASGAGARIRVLAASPSGRLRHPGFLRITLDAVKDANGTWVHFNTAPLSERGKSHEKRNAGIIGGVTAVGATIGAIAGGGKGAAIGAVSGAGAGTAGAYATGKKDVGYAAERILKFRTESEIVVGQ